MPRSSSARTPKAIPEPIQNPFKVAAAHSNTSNENDKTVTMNQTVLAMHNDKDQCKIKPFIKVEDDDVTEKRKEVSDEESLDSADFDEFKEAVKEEEKVQSVYWDDDRNSIVNFDTSLLTHVTQRGDTFSPDGRTTLFKPSTTSNKPKAEPTPPAAHKEPF